MQNTAFQKFYLVHSWILFPISCFTTTHFWNSSHIPYNSHCIKSVRSQSYSGLLHSDWIRRYRIEFVSLRIQSECWKIRTRKTTNTDTFHAVSALIISPFFSCIHFFDYYLVVREKFHPIRKVRLEILALSNRVTTRVFCKNYCEIVADLLIGKCSMSFVKIYPVLLFWQCHHLAI